MQNIKNFKMVSATPELLAEFNNDTSVFFLESEDGVGWYAAQQLFADDTIKIQYDENGVIHAVVDAPVPQRGNVYAVSVLWPINASVAEIAVADYPAGVTTDGTWIFDGTTIYQDSDIVAANTLATNTAKYNAILRACTDAAFPLQSVVTMGTATDEQVTALAELQQYAADLINPDIVDLTQSPLQVPPPPAALSTLFTQLKITNE